MLKSKIPETYFCLLKKDKVLPQQRGLLHRLENKWFKGINIYISLMPAHLKSSIMHNPEHTRCKSAKKAPLKSELFQVYHPTLRIRPRLKELQFIHTIPLGTIYHVFKSDVLYIVKLLINSRNNKPGLSKCTWTPIIGILKTQVRIYSYSHSLNFLLIFLLIFTQMVLNSHF